MLLRKKVVLIAGATESVPRGLLMLEALLCGLLGPRPYRLDVVLRNPRVRGQQDELLELRLCDK